MGGIKSLGVKKRWESKIRKLGDSLHGSEPFEREVFYRGL